MMAGWLSDRALGDPERWPHPVVWFGRAISRGERRLNRGERRMMKGAVLAVGLTVGVYGLAWALRMLLSRMTAVVVGVSGSGGQFTMLFDVPVIFWCLAGTTLVREVRAVFLFVDRSLEEGRRRVARIVGRDTSGLTAQEVRTAALETLAENLSDGVIAPLFWLALLGTPGMLAYKMVNTLDSMIGYRTARYRTFGCWAARMDDIANYVPARLTALLMVVAAGRPQLLRFVARNGRRHVSPNSGFPEAALAGILDCRFGGPHEYFGERFDKPYIGDNDRLLTILDMKKAVRVNRTAEGLMVLLLLLLALVRSIG